MATITLSMIVKNEEKYLRECLGSIKDVVNEIVIVDTGSTDSTIKIAEEFDAKIFYFDWVNDFSAARNFALSKSTGDWILYLDADERLSQDSLNSLIRITKINENLGVKCSVISLNDKGNISQSMKYTRLFKNNDKIEFNGKVHEQIEPSLVYNDYKIIDSDIEIDHHGYSVSMEDIKVKAERNLTLLLDEYKSNSSSYNSYQIGNSYLILEQNDEAVKYFKEALRDKKLAREFKSICYLQLADFEMRNGNLENAKSNVQEGLKLDPNHTILNLIASQVYSKLKDKDQTLKYCKKALQLNLNTNSNNQTNNQKVYVDTKKIIYEGILNSLNFNCKGDLQYYLAELRKNNFVESDIIKKIVNNNIIKEDLNILQTLVNDDNLEMYLRFICKSNNEFKLEFYSNLYNRFSDNSKYLNSFGSFLITINQVEEAKIILELSISNNNYEDSTIFYLASIYVKTNEIEKLKNLINIAEDHAENNFTLQAKLKMLKEKISPLLNSTFAS